MAPMHPALVDQPAPTRPRLQSVNHDFSDLNEQIRQIAHIICLPGNWAHISDEVERTNALQHVVRARAEWVLRWILDKLKDEAEAGTEARRNPTAWQLLQCMIHILPVSRSAPHLRYASFTTILERTLAEHFDRDIEASPMSHNGDIHMRDPSESSETIQEDTQPSRKRKRGMTAALPSKKTTLGTTDLATLFRIVSHVLKSITSLFVASSKTHDTTQMELMKMVLRTESAQASRILKFWLVAVHWLSRCTLASKSRLHDLVPLMDLSIVLEVWDLRIVDSGDSTGTSSDEFSNECLVPALQLGDALMNVRLPARDQRLLTVLDTVTQALDKLLARHLLAPSRAAFFAGNRSEPARKNVKHQEAATLTTNLAPLRAELLQATQIEDFGEIVPSNLASSFKAIAYLLDLAIRASPSKSPKSRLAEKHWIQAVFVSLSECVGCSLQAPPEFVTSRTAVAALQNALAALQAHNIMISSAVLRDLFWYHCGVKYPQCSEREIHWVLIAALMELDASMFVTKPHAVSDDSMEEPTDLAEFIFEQISKTEFKGPGFTDSATSNKDGSTDDLLRVENRPQASRELILKHVIVPMISTFSRNRNLLGYLRRWDDQLVKSYRLENQKALKEKREPIWEDRILMATLSDVFESSLTQIQIAKLLDDHAKRIDDLSGAMAVQADEGINVRKLAAYKKASSSAVVIPAILQSIQSDDIITSLKPQLQSLFVSYATWVHDDQFSSYTRLASSWFTLCQLVIKLWPVNLHSSLQLQQMLLYPLIEQATKDVSTDRKTSSGRRIDSCTRAAAMLFLLDACDRLQTVQGSKDLVQISLRKVMKILSTSRLEPTEHMKMVEIFCANFVQILSLLDAGAARESFLTMLSRLSAFDDNVGDRIGWSFSQAVFEHGSSTLHDAYSSALSDALDQRDETRLHEVSVKAFLHIQPSVLSREKRESILNRLTRILSTRSSDATRLLSVMVQLMQVPNASAKISTDGSSFFDIAIQLQKEGVRSRSTRKQLQRLCQRTLGHIIPNQSQAQSRAFLGEFQKKLNSLTKGTSKASATGLAILRATILEQKDSQLLSVKHYLGVLKQCLTDDGSNAEDTAPLDDVLDAFKELPLAILGDATHLNATASWLRAWINDNADLDLYITSCGPVSTEVANYVAQLHAIVAKFGLYPNAKWLVALTIKIARDRVSDEAKRSAIATLTGSLMSLETTEKLSLVPLLVNVINPLDQAVSYHILNHLVSTLSDKVSTSAELKQKQLALLPRLCTMLAETSDATSFNALMNGIDVILDDKASFTTQHSVECVLSVLVKFTSRTSPALLASNACHIFTRLCETSRLVLLVHRNKLGGRSHLLLPLLQGLLFCLFMPTSARSSALPPWLRSNGPTQPTRLTCANANHYTRLLGTLCNPPQSSISKAHQHSQNSRDLNDPVKAARERMSRFLYPLLASFCRFQLSGRLEPAVRVKLMPGIWEVMGTASLHKEEMDAMFAGLGRSEKDVWRSIWGEWESVHGRKERFVSGDLMQQT